MWRIAIYAREPPDGRGGARLERRLAGLAGHVATRPEWCHVATYADRSLARPWARPGVCRMLADAPYAFNVVAVERYEQLSPNRDDLDHVLGQLAFAGVQAVVLGAPAGRRLTRLVANLALADVIGTGLG